MIKSLIFLSVLAAASASAGYVGASVPTAYGLGYSSSLPYSYGGAYSAPYAYNSFGYDYAAASPLVSKHAAIAAPLASYHTPYAGAIAPYAAHAPVSTSYANTYKVSLKTPLPYSAAAHYPTASAHYPTASAHYPTAAPLYGAAYSYPYGSHQYGAYPSLAHGYPYGLDYYHH